MLTAPVVIIMLSLASYTVSVSGIENVLKFIISSGQDGQSLELELELLELINSTQAYFGVTQAYRSSLNSTHAKFGEKLLLLSLKLLLLLLLLLLSLKLLLLLLSLKSLLLLLLLLLLLPVEDNDEEDPHIASSVGQVSIRLAWYISFNRHTPGA